MEKTRVAIVGASGYTGMELMRLLARHPGVELTLITSRQHAGLTVAEVFPSLRDIVKLEFVDFELADMLDLAEVFFTALPHKTALPVVAGLYRAGRRVIDLSADYRFCDRGLYEKWYQPHDEPEVLAEAVYGLPELFREKIPTAQVVGNPGCYPTSVILPLAPIVGQSWVDAGATIVIDAKSGISGAGRGLSLGSLYCEVNEDFRPYKAGAHRHQPEMVEKLQQAAGVDCNLLFVPHLLPVNRGILSSIYVPLKEKVEAAEVAETLARAYGDEPFVRLLEPGKLPSLSGVRGSNFCDIGFVVSVEGDRLILFSAIDNLVKGAAGQAVQNLNLMQGWPETLGLETIALTP